MGLTRTGPTPLGGVRSVLYLFAPDGAEVEDLDRAASAELIEYAEQGDELGRTYVSLGSPEIGDLQPPHIETAGLVADPNAPDLGSDGTKGTWDMWQLDRRGIYRPVVKLEQLLEVLGLSSSVLSWQRAMVCQLLELPAWDPAPDELKREVYAWLESTREE